ncbi:PTS sugar transporter subunit IIA [Tetragenococcus halophilus]|uniref:PTS sugar transporter subunit IIA n=1 Tax=Tetragenococcus halophilus TaxID=51669 RepID=UPI001F18EA02|nr:PTS sugar transporter subunit IIA [Tetragenococcus halophilus]MCF1684245.1 PTS sugar transporter subunit IIA [Tetragenococcus halophilus]
MIGILILTHGELAKGFLSALKLISGSERQIEGIGLFHETDIGEYKETVEEKIKDMDQGEGVLVFCDIFGASPYNVTAQNFKSLKDIVRYRAVTGVSLPMIIEAVYCRENMSLDALAQHVQQMGKEGIKELFDTVRGSETNE